MFKVKLFGIALAGSMFAGLLSYAQVINIPVVTQNNALLLQVDTGKNLKMVYFGARLADAKEYGLINNTFRESADYADAYTASGSTSLLEPAISVTHTDGNKSLSLKYVSHQVTAVSKDVSLLTIILKDPVYNVEVKLCYKTFFKDDVTEQWSVITHHEKGSIVLNKYASANLSFKGKDFYLRQYHSDWGHEMRPEEQKLTHGIKTIDTKLGARANLFEASLFMVSFDKPATEDEGKVFLGSMEWTGNYREDFELDPQSNLRLMAGINNYASDYVLKPGEEFKTPPFLYTYSENGKGDASRKLQRWARNYKIVDGNGTRLTLLNNWEATFFDFNETKLSQLIKDTKKLGVDMFLLDDGWFGNKYPRNDDNAGLGDWQENKQKLPGGISYLVKQATAEGVKFGIWIEPEMVNPASELYKKHLDWVLRQPNRPEKYYRNQLVLDLANPKVQDFVYDIVDSLFIKNPKLAYIKWDCNAVIYNAYSAYLGAQQSQLYVDYVNGLYKVLERIRAKYPKVPMMLCSGGGGRVDYGALQYFTEYWPSDDTEPVDRVFLQWEYSYFFPALTSSNHVTNTGKQPIKFRIDVAMMGKLGFDLIVSKLTDKELSFCHEALNNYNNLKDVIWHGDQYRLQSPWDNDAASVMYVSENKSRAVMFNYLINTRFDGNTRLPILLKGLNPAKKYKLTEINLYADTKSIINQETIYTGDFLMHAGINPDVNSERTSVVLQIDEVK